MTHRPRSVSGSALVFAALAVAACGGGGGGGGGANGGAAAGASAGSGSSGALDGRIEVLTYNVAGLPDPLTQSSPAVYTIQISPLLNAYEVVLVQEDFWYHGDLAALVTHPYRSQPMSGPLQGGSRLMNDGLNHFSTYPTSPVDRHAWAVCNGLWDAASDCLASKGFAVTELTLRAGVEVDVYNLHMDAGGGAGDILARQRQMEQLRDHIAQRGPDRALIVAGDFNLHGYDPDDEPIFQGLLAGTGLTDVCRALACNDDRIDRVLYRSGRSVELRPLGWQVATEFVDPSGHALSDHKAIHATLGWVALVP